MNRKDAIEVIKKNLPDSSFTRLREALETLIPELKESDDERIRKQLIAVVELYYGETDEQEKKDCLSWLEKQGEQKLCMIQWKGDNLKEVINFTGKSKNFDKWFKSFEEYEKYVSDHNGVFKMFYEDGSHYEVPVGAWIVKTPDGYNVASKAIFIQKPAWCEEDEGLLNSFLHKLEVCNLLSNKENVWAVRKLKSLKDRYTWKPSEEQMEVLNWCKPLWNEPKTKAVLESLIEDLKKLREE